MEIWDGAMGTMLQHKGFPRDRNPVLANRQCPKLVREIHKEYVKAGANVLTTNTFQLPEDYVVKDVIHHGISLAKLAKPKKVALSIGPLDPALSLEQQQLSFEQQAYYGEKYGADMLLFETFFSLSQGLCAVESAKKQSTLPIILSFSYNEEGRLYSGESAEKVAECCKNAGISAIGINCTSFSEKFLPIIMVYENILNLPILLKPNAGQPILEQHKLIYPISAEHFAQEASKLCRPSVTMIGGCCGTTPEYIKALGECL